MGACACCQRCRLVFDGNRCCIISIIIGLVGGGQFSITSLVLNLLLPGLYVYGAMQMKGTA